ncbi:hypothetical protein K8T06_01120 [bacterium]|nr:hypothetical protein [bacterium]
MDKIVTPPYFIFVLVGCLLISCATGKNRWNQVCSENTIRAYEEFQSKYPDSEYSSEAHQRSENLYWQKAIDANSLIAYKDYLKKFRKGKYSSQAMDKIDNLTWKDTVSSLYSSSYEKYLKDFPRGKHVSEAKSKLEDMSWQLAVKKDTPDGYIRFLKLYPQSEYAQDGKSRLDFKSWIKAKSLGTIHSYSHYIQINPTGEHVKTARSRIKSLEKERDQFLIYVDHLDVKRVLTANMKWQLDLGAFPSCFIQWDEGKEAFRQFPIDIGEGLFMTVPLHSFMGAEILDEKQSISIRSGSKAPTSFVGRLLGALYNEDDDVSVPLNDLKSISIKNIPVHYGRVEHKPTGALWELRTDEGAHCIIANPKFSISFHQSYYGMGRSTRCFTTEIFTVLLPDDRSVETSFDKLSRVDFGITSKKKVTVTVKSRSTSKQSTGGFKLTVPKPRPSRFSGTPSRSGVDSWCLIANSVDYPGTLIMVYSSNFVLTRYEDSQRN